MNLTQLQSAIEAVIFASKGPISDVEIAGIFSLDKKEAHNIILNIRDRHATEVSGFELVEAGSGYIFKTKGEWAEVIESLSTRERASALSQAALETLAIVAYRQPITRGEVEKIRNVSSDSSIVSLCERGLIKECGRKNTPGRPILYATTDEFLIHMGLKSLSELNKLSDEENSDTLI